MALAFDKEELKACEYLHEEQTKDHQVPSQHVQPLNRSIHIVHTHLDTTASRIAEFLAVQGGPKASTLTDTEGGETL